MTADLSVQRFTGLPAEWDALVHATAGWTHFQLHGWRDVVERVFAHECLCLEAREAGGALRGVLPLVRVKSVLFGHFLVSMPFVNYGGPLGDRDAVRALATAAAAEADASGARLLELRSRVPLDLDLPVSHRKITVVLEVPDGGPERLWSTLPSKLRSQVRRPQKEGVTTRFGLDQVAPFHAVFARHMRDLGTPVQSRKLFAAIAAAFPEDAWFGCAYLGGAPIAAGAGFRWGNEFEMTWAAALREHNRTAPNMALYWAFMERCAEQGVRVFNFGRCTPGSGTHRFKRQWGPTRDEQLWWYQHGPGREAGTPSPEHGAYSLGPRVWRHLPLPLANAVGPRIVKFIP